MQHVSSGITAHSSMDSVSRINIIILPHALFRAQHQERSPYDEMIHDPILPHLCRASAIDDIIHV